MKPCSRGPKARIIVCNAPEDSVVWSDALVASRPIHPFPARMAPEIALARCGELPSTAIVLDPMAGSGTVPRAAVDAGLRAIGFDVDPLAVLMTRVWTTPIDTDCLCETARDVASSASRTRLEPDLPWIDGDRETRTFVDYWFGPVQQRDLRRLSVLLREQGGPIGDALRVALSRLIVTKDRGASLARDVSHSRPHRIGSRNNFDVLPAFLRSAETIAPRLIGKEQRAAAEVTLGDARQMRGLGDATIDAIITSPPYLNAIDYLRGHRLSLVWLGYRVSELREIRAESVGAERALARSVDRAALHGLGPVIGQIDALPARVRGMVDRYLLDLLALMQEMRRVLKSGGAATLVVGNSRLRGVLIDNAEAVTTIAGRVGLDLVERNERELPPARRYLPPPQGAPMSSEPQRMRTEVVLTFRG